MISHDIRPGSKVVFCDPQPDELDADGKQIPMRVLEVNGDRLLLQSLVDMNIKPTSVHPLVDVKLAE